MKDNVYEIYSHEDRDFFIVGDKTSPFTIRLDSDKSVGGSTWTFYIADSRLTDRLKFVLSSFFDSICPSQSILSVVSAEFTDYKKTHNYLVHNDDYGNVCRFRAAVMISFNALIY